MKPILVVDDEPAIADLIAMVLEKNGYACDIANDGITAANYMEEKDYALALLDIMLPEIDGYDLLEYAQQLGVPVIFITAKGALKERVKGLGLGADDYIVKPFEPEEMLARVKNVLRRAGLTEERLQLGDVVLDTTRFTVTKDGAPVALTPREFTLLSELMRRPGKVFSREQLYEAVWGEEANYDSRTLDLHVARLRKKLGWQNMLRVQYKVGYVLEVGANETGG